MGTQLTLRNVSPELAARLKALAEQRSDSVNSVAVSILEKAVGVHHRQERLARYTTSTPADLDDFEQTMALQRSADPNLWK